MVLEDHEMPKGWPLGLGNLNMRLRVAHRLQPAGPEPYSLHAPSSSFSSFSSSNLDTESTASFFQDHSVSLGRLIGIRSRERGPLYLPSANQFEEQHDSLSGRTSSSDIHGHDGVEGGEMSRGICVPVLVSILMKISRSRSNSRQ
ncbi:uncharacterized protein LOC127793984 isoform X2 [Diospyros lotus]|uniref:uncharacterized protein LOC127793984 isoform X2 n=1 Tax=Diospyros lotus TaxID=55363 RepID=UPI00224D85E7|nr:uncharacterized protein LOC127793984 isoform X2 [Diospyros lotus]